MTAKASEVGGYHPWTTYVYAREEARRRGDRRVGTEHLVLGLLREPEVAPVLGCDLGAAREALDAMDRDALVAVGIDRRLDAPPIPTREPALRGGRAILKAVLADQLPATPVAKRVMEEAGKDARHRPAKQCWSRERVLIALLSLAPPDPAAALLDALEVNRDEVSTRLSEPSAA
ncbi:MAG TPA: Clp protease N-terminal domain-containing protein [Candidatus Dormibacteraeota bacterium]|nr:Clp protease N-terminal domain-containing protein [Candidatus Dormibacteraeota bacterium]